jgi:hypothetical protein
MSRTLETTVHEIAFSCCPAFAAAKRLRVNFCGEVLLSPGGMIAITETGLGRLCVGLPPLV